MITRNDFTQGNEGQYPAPNPEFESELLPTSNP